MDKRGKYLYCGLKCYINEIAYLRNANTGKKTIGTFQTSSWLEVSIFRPGPQFTSLDELPLWTREYSNPQQLQSQLSPTGHKLVAGRPQNAAMGAQGGEAPLAWYLQGNKVAERYLVDYQVVWAPGESQDSPGAGNGDGFFDVLQEGDSVLVWARAKVSHKT